MGHKEGDNTQVMALAEGLGWPFEVKHMVYKKTELLSNLLLGPTLAGIHYDESTPLAAPWPDLVITAGRRNEPVARWIKKQSKNTTRLVHLGRPWAQPDRFDLIVTTPQYQLPKNANILHNTLPLHRVTTQRLNEAADQWAGTFSQLPKPYISVLVGGNSGPFTLDPVKSSVLAHAVDKMAQELKGSLLVTTSARTPVATSRILQSTIKSPMYFHRWSSGNKSNPYYAYLAFADHIVVTGDSVSMLAEACIMGKPVYLFDLSDGPRSHRPKNGSNQRNERPWWLHGYNYRLRPLSHRLAMRLGPRRMVRNVSAMHDHLINNRYAVWLGDRFKNRPGDMEIDDLRNAVTRIRSLIQLSGNNFEFCQLRN
jgi:mitochondrial fission protein ELM1